MLQIFYELTPNVYAEMQTVRYKGWQVGVSCSSGNAATGNVPFDDPGGTLDIKGWRKCRIVETTASPTLIWSGRIRNKTVKRGDSERGSLRTGADRWWDCDAIDQNTLLGSRIIRGTSANRPAETAGERLAWLLSTPYTVLYDGGHITYPSDALDPEDFTLQTAADVIANCALPGGYNFFAMLDQIGGFDVGELFFMLPTSSDWASSVAISDDPADYNGASVFAPSYDASLLISDDIIASGVAVAYDGGTSGNAYVYVDDDDIGDEFAYVDKTAPLANVKTSAKATVIANRHLALSSTEDERITCTVHVPADKANAIRPWHRVPYKSTWMPGFSEYRDCRVVEWSIEQQPHPEGGEGYLVHLELSPVDETAVSCATIISSTQVELEIEDVTTDPSVAMTTSGGGMLIAWLSGTNGNTPAATNMTAIGGGFTELYNTAGFSRSTFRIGAKSTSDGASESASATFTSGFSIYNDWIAALVRLNMPYATPVQTKVASPGWSVTMDSTPTPGNVILVFGFTDSLGSTGPAPGPNDDPDFGPTSWSTVFAQYHKYENSEFGMVIYAHCVEEGETGLYAYAGAGGYTTAQWCMAAEYAP